MSGNTTKIAKKQKRKPIEKPYNAGTMTASAFFSMIRSALRQSSRWWKPIAQAKNNARRPYKGTNKRRKWEYQCNECKQWFDGTTVNVDHIVPVGTLTCFEDLPLFAKNLFCEAENLQCLCATCHDKKTKEDKQKKK